MERVGIRLRFRNSGLPESLHGKETANTIDGDPVALIIGLNVHRRHLTKQQQADLIVAAHKAAAEASRQVGEVSQARTLRVRPDQKRMRPRPRRSPRPKSIASVSAPSSGPSQRRKASTPEPKTIAGPRLKTKPKLETHVGIDAARKLLPRSVR